MRRLAEREPQPFGSSPGVQVSVQGAGEPDLVVIALFQPAFSSSSPVIVAKSPQGLVGAICSDDDVSVGPQARRGAE